MQMHLPASLGNVWLRTLSQGMRRCALFGITAAANLLFRLDKVLGGRHVGSYIEFAIYDLQPSFERRGAAATGGKKTANAELGGKVAKKSVPRTTVTSCRGLKRLDAAPPSPTGVRILKLVQGVTNAPGSFRTSCD